MNNSGSTPIELVLTTFYVAPPASALIPTYTYLGF